jgi:hypothetical protein
MRPAWSVEVALEMVATADVAVVGEVIKLDFPPGELALLLKYEHEGVRTYLSLIVKRVSYCILFILANAWTSPTIVPLFLFQSDQQCRDWPTTKQDPPMALG